MGIVDPNSFVNPLRWCADHTVLCAIAFDRPGDDAGHQ